MEVILITGRALTQGTTREARKTTSNYVKAAAICELDPDDLAKLGVGEGTPVRVRTDHGSVVVYAALSTQAPHPGIAFVPMGPWANQVIRPETDGTGMPSYKSVPAIIEPAPTETVQDAATIFKKMVGGSR